MTPGPTNGGQTLAGTDTGDRHRGQTPGPKLTLDPIGGQALWVPPWGQAPIEAPGTELVTGTFTR